MALDMKTAEWHEERRRGVGASDVPAICGVSTFAKPIDIWQTKVGLREPVDETPAMRWGNLLEPVIADEFTTQTGIKVRRLARAVRYRDWPVLFAHLDRTSSDAILEVKSSMSTRGWGDTGSADIPDYVALQVQAQLACADKERAYVAALLGYRDFRWFEVPRDRELFDEAVLPILREFWRLVETETPPEPDGSDEYAAFLRRRFATDDGTERAATPEEQLLGLDLVSVRAARVAAEIKEEELVQRLQKAMGETTRLAGPGWQATWKKSKDSERTDWKLVALAYREAIERTAQGGVVEIDGTTFAMPDALDAIQSLYTETKPGPRPFRFVLTSKEGEGD